MQIHFGEGQRKRKNCLEENQLAGINFLLEGHPEVGQAHWLISRGGNYSFLKYPPKQVHEPLTKSYYQWSASFLGIGHILFSVGQTHRQTD